MLGGLSEQAKNEGGVGGLWGVVTGAVGDSKWTY